MSDSVMSDSSFSRFFIIMIVVMTALTAMLMVLASVNAKEVNDKLTEENTTQKIPAISENLAPFGEFSSAKKGELNSVNTIMTAETTTEPSQSTEILTAEQMYQQNCSACHGAGIAGAPAVGNKSAWADRVTQDISVMYDHAIKGFAGKSGYMPAKGGASGLSDEQVKSIVDYMITKSR